MSWATAGWAKRLRPSNPKPESLKKSVMGATANCASCKLHFYAPLPRTCGDARTRSYLWLARSSTASRCCSNIASRELIEEPPPLSFRNASSDTLHSTVTPLAASLIGKGAGSLVEQQLRKHKW